MLVRHFMIDGGVIAVSMSPRELKRTIERQMITFPANVAFDEIHIGKGVEKVADCDLVTPKVTGSGTIVSGYTDKNGEHHFDICFKMSKVGITFVKPRFLTTPASCLS